MNGPDPSYLIELEAEELQVLLKLSRATTAPQVHMVRSKILLLAHDHSEYSNVQIAKLVGCVLSTARKWRKRYYETKNLLDAPRSDAPRRFLPEIRVQTTALPCSLPRQQGLPLARHSSESTARQLKDSGQVARICAATVRRWLRQDKLKP